MCFVGTVFGGGSAGGERVADGKGLRLRCVVQLLHYT